MLDKKVMAQFEGASITLFEKHPFLNENTKHKQQTLMAALNNEGVSLLLSFSNYCAEA